jgi:hypothetical protein
MTFDRNRGESQIDVDNIQGDVLIGLQKSFQSFIGFTIVDVPSFRAFISVLAPRITTLRLTLERELILDMRRAAGSSEVFTFVGTRAFPEKTESGGIPIRTRIGFKIRAGKEASMGWGSRIRRICVRAW